ncbi:MAG: hypothetical protein M9955_17125 [Rhizobiaceae bacterium]|nr:hypothetical protein [Rhizobiaceae bacterium]
MKVHSSHDVEFDIARWDRSARSTNRLFFREQIATADLGDVVLDISQSANRMVFFVEHPNGDIVLFNIKPLLDVAAHILLEGHPAERSDPINLAGSGPVPIEPREN